MTSVADRFRTVAATFDDMVDVAAHMEGGWARPAPCTGWVAGDVVDHLAGWVPGFLEAGAPDDDAVRKAVTAMRVPDSNDRVSSWRAVRDGLQSLLDDPSSPDAAYSHPMAGNHRLADAIDRFILSDVLVHSWDLGRAVGVDVTLDERECEPLLAGFEAMGDALSASGHFGRPVSLGSDASPSVQDRMLAATGRDPAWRPDTAN